MAENSGVWGVEIGQAGLKAIRLRYAEAANQVIAVAFDYVPHPKILSQPDAVPEELIPQALEQFLSRNDVKGDQVVISVPGQTALARFVNLPPVPANKVPEIVKYEARQTIPFALEDVIWDYQVLSAGSEESDFLLDAEVGIFAMKRDEIASRLKHFQAKKVEVDQIQIAPLALYNMVSYDKMGLRLGEDQETTDEYTIVLDMGADNTTLVVTNGAKIWIRNVPIGGNHFTRALTKEMKLTFAKAEHLKCNATKAPDPRAVFQALRPVFNDYVSEIQRSIGYFSSVNRNAKIQKIIGVGNGFKLAGLQKFLHQNLQYDVERLNAFDGAAGDAVVGDPLFQENILTFAVPYGLALQGLKLTRIHTSLLPPEIIVERKIRAKKPWAAAAAAAMLLGVALSGVGYATVASSVSTDRFGEAEEKVAALQSTVSGFQTAYDQKKTDNTTIKSKGQVVIDNLEKRDQWLELFRAVNAALPKSPGANPNDPSKQQRIHLQAITQTHVDDLSQWYKTLDNSAVNSMAKVDRKPPTGPGFLVTVHGYHYHQTGHKFEKETLLTNLGAWQHGGVPIREMGISHPVLIETQLGIPRQYHPNSQVQQFINATMGRNASNNFVGPGMPGGGSDFNVDGQSGNAPTGFSQSEWEEAKKQIQKLIESRFVLQFVWQPVLHSERELDNLLWALLKENPAATIDEAQQRVAAYNEQLSQDKIAGRNADKQPLELTEEKFTAFRTKHIDEGTEVPPETPGGGGGVGGGGEFSGEDGGYAPPTGGGGHGGI